MDRNPWPISISNRWSIGYKGESPKVLIDNFTFAATDVVPEPGLKFDFFRIGVKMDKVPFPLGLQWWQGQVDYTFYLPSPIPHIIVGIQPDFKPGLFLFEKLIIVRVFGGHFQDHFTRPESAVWNTMAGLIGYKGCNHRTWYPFTGILYLFYLAG